MNRNEVFLIDIEAKQNYIPQMVNHVRNFLSPIGLVIQPEKVTELSSPQSFAAQKGFVADI